jgi:hypothetical protein
LYQLLTKYHPRPLMQAGGHYALPVILSLIYLAVTTALLGLAFLSRGFMERCYFLFCASSAATGLLRIVFGDPTVNAGNLLRVVMLGCAVVVGVLMLRAYSVEPVELSFCE